MFNKKIFSKNIGPFFVAAYRKWRKDEALNAGAALAYYTLISLPALLLSLGLILTLFIDRTSVAARFTEALTPIIGTAYTETVLAMVQESSGEGRTYVQFLIGAVFAFFGATGIFIQLQTALNRIWGVPPPKHRSWTTWFKKRGRALGAIVVIAAIFLLTGAANGVLLYGLTLAAAKTEIPTFVLYLVQLLVNVGIFWIIFTSMFFFLPEGKIHLVDAIKGGLLTSLLFILGELAIGTYLSASNLGSSFGVGRSLIVVLVWVYYSAQIVFIGAEITQAYTEAYGKGIRYRH